MTPEQEAEILEAWQKMVNAGLSPDYYWLLSIVEDNQEVDLSEDDRLHPR